MIFGSGNQNKTLSIAAGKPKDTSHRLLKANENSSKVSSSKISAKISNAETGIKVESGTSQKSKGSFEGLDNGTSSYIQPNGVGYDDPSNHKARYNKNFISHNDNRFNFSLAPVDKNYSTMDNYSSFTEKNSSSNKINNIIKNNMMFK